MSTSGKAVFLSALTVVLLLAAVFLVPLMVFQTMALGTIISVIGVALAALTLLPAVLVAMGDKVLIARIETSCRVQASPSDAPPHTSRRDRLRLVSAGVRGLGARGLGDECG
jgi:uncharacterized membrane protein YdfJ with MMPL/SSD domain